MEEHIQKILFALLDQITGLNSFSALGGISLNKNTTGRGGETISYFFNSFLNGGEGEDNRFSRESSRAINSFVKYYSQDKNYSRLISLWDEFTRSENPELKAQIAMKICVPELDTSDIPVLAKWKLNHVEKNPDPYKPEEITIQLNALYSLPEQIDPAVPEKMIQQWNSINQEEMKHIADYDHPVPLFAPDENHELLVCLREMDRDIAFEKKHGTFDKDYRVPVSISISVTHDLLDEIATEWVNWLLKEEGFRHLSFIVLTEQTIRKIRQELYKGSCSIYSVFGKYAVHFNALKYTQLLLEKAYGIRAGFKLDTDEGMRSRDLHAATGKTWFETLCHPYWGGLAKEFEEKEIYLGINEGEYINSTDIDKFGYSQAYRMPEVKLPASFISQQLLFFKAYAQGYVTKLYNTVQTVDECISHPVVKGGGYGIDNRALREYNPFALSDVGRAEDQQFYFNGLSKGLRGIFHPDLRIAHYKQSVQTSEVKQKGTKFLGDMYRLLIFSHIVSLLGVKEDIDPFPGLFAGEMSYFQYFFNLMYQGFCFSTQGEDEITQYLLDSGLPMLEDLIVEIESGSIQKKLLEEEKMWQEFVSLTDALDPSAVLKTFDSIKLY